MTSHTEGVGKTRKNLRNLESSTWNTRSRADDKGAAHTALQAAPVFGWDLQEGRGHG